MSRNKMTECNSCKHRRCVPGDTHIACAKPDPLMEGNLHGVRQGWFFYPICFDPIWKARDCDNWEKL